MSPRALTAELLSSSLEAGAEARIAVDGRSMLPLIRPGDTLVIGAPSVEGPRRGDVVAVRGMPAGGLLLHRVVRRTGQTLEIRGDNTAVGNGEFQVGEIIGVVTAVERGGRRVWYGAGRLGRTVAFAVRHGVVWRADRLVYGLRRRSRACLKFRSADSRLPEQNREEGNE